MAKKMDAIDSSRNFCFQQVVKSIGEVNSSTLEVFVAAKTHRAFVLFVLSYPERGTCNWYW